MIETNVTLNILLRFVIPTYKSCYKYWVSYKAKLLIIPYDNLKKRILKFLVDKNIAVIDIDHPDAYITSSDEEDLSRFTNNKINLRRLVRRLKEYTLNEFKDDCRFVVYICSNFDYCNLFNKTCIYTLIPSSVYLEINHLDRDELFEIKAKTLKIRKRNKLAFSTEEDALTLVMKRICGVDV